MQPPHHALMLPLWLFKERWASEGFGTPVMLWEHWKRGCFLACFLKNWQSSPRGEMLSCSWLEWRTAEVNVLHTDQHAWHIMCFCNTELDIYTDRSFTASLPGRVANNDAAYFLFLEEKQFYYSDLGTTSNTLCQHWVLKDESFINGSSCQDW